MPLIYTLPTENVADDPAIVLVTGTADAENPLANLTNGDPAIAFMTTDSVGLAVTFDFGSAQRIDLASMPMHGIPAGTAVKVQGHTADSWATPDINAAMSIATFRGSGFPEVGFADITQDGGYTVGGKRWWRLLVPSHGGITKIGDFELWVQKRTLTTHVSWGFGAPTRRHLADHRRVDQGHHRYDYQTEFRNLDGGIDAESADHDLLFALQDAALGALLPFLIQGALRHDATTEAMYVEFSEPTFDPRFPTFGRADVPFRVDEVARGMPL